jgi:hypothetical protein
MNHHATSGPRRGAGASRRLEDTRDALIEAGQLGVVLHLEAQIRVLSRKLGFDD